MSMLTPPDMGGPYRIKGNKYPRMRRNRRRRLTLLAVGAALVAAVVGWGVLQLIDVFSGDAEDTRSAAAEDDRPRCKRSPTSTAKVPAALPEPARVTVNVLNATTRTGLAQDTADELEKRGFRVGEVGNAPKAYDKKVTGTAVLLAAPAAQDAAQVLGVQVRDARTRMDDRDSRAVDLIIGDGFKDLTPRKQARTALAALAKPSPATSPDCH